MPSHASRRRSLTLSGLGAAALLVSALGCGPGADPGDQTVAEAIAGLVADAPDRAAGAQAAQAYFAEGAVPPPAARKRYAAYAFEAAGKPAVRGEAATVAVRVQDADGRPVGQVQWSFVKQGGRWRVKDAPLP